MVSEPADRLRQIAVGFQQARILLAAAELRLFDHLVTGARAAQAASAVGGDARALEIVLDALVAMGVVDKEGDVYRNRPDVGPLLVDDSPTHFAASLRHQNRLFRHWAFLEERMRGEDVPAVDGTPSAADHEDFIRAMFATSHRQAADVVARIDFSGVRTVGDLGGGPGHYLAAILQRAPHVEGYLVDLAPDADGRSAGAGREPRLVARALRGVESLLRTTLRRRCHTSISRTCRNSSTASPTSRTARSSGACFPSSRLEAGSSCTSRSWNPDARRPRRARSSRSTCSS